MLLLPFERYSSDISIRLIVNGRALRVAQIGPNRIILRDRIDSASTEAILEIDVSGRKELRTIVLPHGLSRDSDEISYF